MWKTALLIVAPFVVLPLSGLMAGGRIGDATCNDSPDYQSIPDLHCLDEFIYGSLAGLIVGLLMAIALAVVLVRRHRRRRGAETVTIC